jgi:hypothetical protein
MQPITFKDGLTIHGYYYQKRSQVAKSSIDSRSWWTSRRDLEYIAEDQLFASRGYATLHVNFDFGGFVKNL